MPRDDSQYLPVSMTPSFSGAVREYSASCDPLPYATTSSKCKLSVSMMITSPSLWDKGTKIIKVKAASDASYTDEMAYKEDGNKYNLIFDASLNDATYDIYVGLRYNGQERGYTTHLTVKAVSA